MAKFYLPCCTNDFAVDVADKCKPAKIRPKSSRIISLGSVRGLGEIQVNNVSHLPRRLPVGTKYVVESRGDFVHRFIELPDGARIPLRKRKSLTLRLHRAGESDAQIRETNR